MHDGGRKGARRGGELRPEYVALGLLAEGPAHGYELRRRFAASLEGLWRISESQFYATLKRLEARGLIALAEPEPGEGAARRLVSMTEEGRRALRDWIEEPTASSPKLLHLEFLTRLEFARRLEPGLAPRLVRGQAEALRAELARLEGLRAGGAARSGLGDLSLAFRERELRAALDWIEEEVGRAAAGS